MDERPPWDRQDEEEPPADPTEGVRIIGAEEAQEAIERGYAATRRPEGMPRYGEAPPAPEGDRPAYRFPSSSSSEEPTEPPRPRVSGTGMPHWTEPPTGEVPRILAGDSDHEDDLEAWSSFTSQGPRWRDQPGDWDADDASALAHDDESRVGALDDSARPAPDDFFGFDESEPEVAPTPIRTSSRPPGRAEADPLGDPRDVRLAVITGVAFAVAALVLFSIGPAAALLLVGVVIVLAAAELFDALRRAGHQPATLLALVATGSLVGAAYWKGEVAIPIGLGITVVAGLLWYLIGVARTDPTTNLAVTLLGVTWVGVLGSFAALMLRIPDGHGIGILIGAILATVAYDVGGFFVGSRMGRAPLAPTISPNKTYEGLFGGVFGAVLASVIVLHLNPWGIHPWDLGSAFALGLVVAVFAPLGDLCESMIKRDLGLKDMGSVLPGHGGLLDRFDALLFVLPATYYLVLLLEIV